MTAHEFSRESSSAGHRISLRSGFVTDFPKAPSVAHWRDCSRVFTRMVCQHLTSLPTFPENGFQTFPENLLRHVDFRGFSFQNLRSLRVTLFRLSHHSKHHFRDWSLRVLSCHIIQSITSCTFVEFPHHSKPKRKIWRIWVEQFDDVNISGFLSKLGCFMTCSMRRITQGMLEDQRLECQSLVLSNARAPRRLESCMLVL